MDRKSLPNLCSAGRPNKVKLISQVQKHVPDRMNNRLSCSRLHYIFMGFAGFGTVIVIFFDLNIKKLMYVRSFFWGSGLYNK